MPHYPWKPIEPLSERERQIDLAAMPPIYATWLTARERLHQSSPAGLKEFNRRLVRRLSIETGILEQLYDLDRGTTEALVAQGFLEDLLSRSSTDIEPSLLIDILKNHEAAIQLVTDCVAGSRPLTKGILHELHALLTRQEGKTTAIDQFGRRREIPLLKGKFKELPNNPRRPDGTVHEHCPPLHVESEIENLLTWLDRSGEEDPMILAAWLHHRFTQIHPYQDGNGRVARSLTTLILLRAGLLPLVIDRDLRAAYIGALESADAGNISPLACLFARLERAAILQALSVEADQEMASQDSPTAAAIESLRQKLERRRNEKHVELRNVNQVAVALRTQARATVEQYFKQLAEQLAAIAEPQIEIFIGGPDYGNAYWYKFQVIQSANQAGKYSNFWEDHYFLKSSIHVARERLVFVISFHHIGRDLSGMMEATGFARLDSYEDSEDREYETQKFFVCSPEPFVFTYNTNASDITEAFTRWLDAALAVAIKAYGDRL